MHLSNCKQIEALLNALYYWSQRGYLRRSDLLQSRNICYKIEQVQKYLQNLKFIPVFPKVYKSNAYSCGNKYSHTQRKSNITFLIEIQNSWKSEQRQLMKLEVDNDIFIYIYIRISNFKSHHHHHHHIVLAARISLTLSRHSSLSSIALGRSSGQQPVSSNSCWMYVRAVRPAFARPCVGIHKSTSLMSSSLLLQQCPACLVRLTWIVFVIGGRWPYSWCLVGCCCQDLFRDCTQLSCVIAI